MEERWPAMRSYTPAQRERTAEDLAHIVDFLATALYVDDAALFTTFTTWTADILTARRVPAGGLRLGLDILADQLRDCGQGVGRGIEEAQGAGHLHHRPTHVTRLLEVTGVTGHLTQHAPGAGSPEAAIP